MNICVIGGGAAGILAAALAARRGHGVRLLERNRQTCRKLCLTGKGRCNLTNDCDAAAFLQNVRRNPRFLYGALSRFSPADAKAYFEALGVPLKTERGARVFPVSDRAYDVADALLAEARAAGVRVVTARAKAIRTAPGPDGRPRVTGVAGFGREPGEKETFYPCEAVILATGGLSYPATGSDGDGYRMAAELGHTVVPPRPSLVPLEADREVCAPLQGLALKNIGFSLLAGDKILWREQGELLFTHFGVSGPVVLSASAHLEGDGPWRAVIDLKPALDAKTLDERLLRDFAGAENRDFQNSLGLLLPRLLIPAAVRRSGIPPDKKVRDISRAERTRLGALLKAFDFTVHGPRPIAEAVVTAGGVDVAEVDPRTMGSRLVSGLYFAGEILDVDAYTGGFNLQIAWATAYAAANAL